MPQILIDYKLYTFENKPKALEFFLEQNIEVPYFCYHPTMSIPANCRQCLVKAGQYIRNQKTKEIETDKQGREKIRWFPKLMPSCVLDLTDDMVILTQKMDQLVKEAQQANLEFILINHPLDCSICDQAGECPLQIQTYKFGPKYSRFEVKKVHKPKKIILGPMVILDAERCINCTRCTRFTDEISRSKQLTITCRGDKNYPTTAPGKIFDDPYSMNTIDICPVGALTSTDFRFKARVWEMSKTPSIDVSNGMGCAIDLWVRNNLVMRVTPRYNPNINDYWMPDQGRLIYKQFNENRVKHPTIGRYNIKKISKITSWNHALLTLNETIEQHKSEKTLFIGSPYASLEENYSFKCFAHAHKQKQLHYVPHIIKGFGDEFLLTDDQAPNTKGCELMGIIPCQDFKKQIEQASLVVILLDDIIGREIISWNDLKNKTVIVFASNHSPTTQSADLLIPITCAAEHRGSYINVIGYIQKTNPAKAIKRINRRASLTFAQSRLDRFGTSFDKWQNHENKINCFPLWDILNPNMRPIEQIEPHINGEHILKEIQTKWSFDKLNLIDEHPCPKVDPFYKTKPVHIFP